MDNQHRKISGYRELSQEEIDLMNRIKAFGPELETLIQDIRNHVDGQYNAGDTEDEEYQRLIAAEPGKWLDSGMLELQTGLMFLTRAIAQPGFF